MSAVTHPQRTIKEQLHRDQRRAKMVALTGVTILAALLVALVLALNGSDTQTAAKQRPAAELRGPAVPQAGAYPSPSAVPARLHPGTRYDGGPEEGSHATSSSSAGNPRR
jgi:hypothetical protein